MNLRSLYIICNLIRSILIFITTINISTGEELNNSSILKHCQFPSNVVPEHYDIKLIYLSLEKYDFNKAQPSYTKREHASSFIFHGESCIVIIICNPTQNIKLHTPNLAITKEDSKLIDSNNTIYTYEKFIYNFGTEYLDLHFVDMLSPGRYTLQIKFHGRITNNNADNFVRNFYINKRENITWIAPQVEARRLFPCWDEPHLKSTFKISIKHHRNFTALSNMPIQAKYEDEDDDDSMWTHFRTTPPMSTYQVSVVLLNFCRVQINENINLWYANCSKLPLLNYAKRVIEVITSHLESEFNEIKIPKIDHIVFPNLQYNGISKWGLAFYSEADLICIEKFDPIMRQIEVARSIALKITSQWLGNVLSPTWWSQFWLYDGLAILFGEEAVVKMYANSRIMNLFIVQSQYDALHLDSHVDMNPPQINSQSEINNSALIRSRYKVIIVLRMLQDGFTDKVFREGVHACLYKYMFNTMTVNQFWSTQKDSATGANHLEHESYILRNFLYWIMNKHYPIVSWIRITHFSKKLTQYSNASRCNYGKWLIPTSLLSKNTLDGIKPLWLTPKKPSSYMGRNPEDRIIVDIRQAGYYRVYYEVSDLCKIERFLNSEKYKYISVINRAKIIDDAFHFLLIRQFNSTDLFWKLAFDLTRETDYVAWYPMFKVFEYISSAIPLAKDNINFIKLKNTMRELISKTLKILGFKESPLENDFNKWLRLEIVKWACTLELPECLQKAKSNLIEHLKDPEKKILPEWKDWIYCKGFKGLTATGFLDKDLITWPDLTSDGRINLYPYTDGRYVEYIPCFEDQLAVIKIFHILKYKKSELGRQYYIQDEDIYDCINIFNSFIAKHARKKNKLENILLNFHNIIPPEISTAAGLINIINHIYNTTELNMLSLSLKNERTSIHLGQITTKVFSKIETRISEIKKHIEHLDMFL
ncbi:aminopeptidase N-like [Temnothorax americanus]|uniref:aminopeptidase N-like n=1 Tax=Temnothorax americanus TaxID=1964332 RepID=UPI00406901CE